MKTGRLPPLKDERNLRFGTYITEIHAPPLARDWWPVMEVELYQNDRIGLCGLASCAHLQRAWTRTNGAEFVPSEQDVIDAYSAVGGYIPGDPSTDKGTHMLSVLKHWKKHGIAGRKIDAYVQVDHSSAFEIQLALNLGGGVYTGASMPRRALSDRAWYAPNSLTGDDEPGSGGGHAMAMLAYNRSGVMFATWGRKQWATWDWVMAYVDECYCVISSQWCDASTLAPNGLDLGMLEHDVSILGAT